MRRNKPFELERGGVRIYCEAPLPRARNVGRAGEYAPARTAYWQATVDGKPYQTDVPTSTPPGEVRTAIAAWYDRESAAGRFTRGDDGLHGLSDAPGG